MRRARCVLNMSSETETLRSVAFDDHSCLSLPPQIGYLVHELPKRMQKLVQYAFDEPRSHSVDLLRDECENRCLHILHILVDHGQRRRRESWHEHQLRLPLHFDRLTVLGRVRGHRVADIAQNHSTSRSCFSNVDGRLHSCRRMETVNVGRRRARVEGGVPQK